jgi:hypothetical protein
MFEKTKARINTQINDRVTAPVRTSLIISIVTFLVAGIALLAVVTNADR